MWQIGKPLVCICIVFFASPDYANMVHLEKLKSQYPYGLIGDDHGILTKEDLAVNTCNTTQVKPFAEGQNQTYSYWQCFPLKEAQMICDSLGYDSVEKKETGYLEVKAKNTQGIQTYLANDPRDMQSCRNYLHRWKRKTRGEKYVCLSGSYGRLEDAQNNRKEMTWVFDKFKTRKGCVSLGSDCSLKKVSKELRQTCIAPRG